LQCEVYLGPQEDQKPGIKEVTDGDNIKIGSIELEFILTPGLSADCLAVALKENGEAKFLFPSELFLLNDVTKPDNTLPKA